MNTISTLDEIRHALAPLRRASRIGLVPTMGAFHAGHVALFRAARRLSDVVVVSSFVNPPQFGDPANLAAYPRDAARDARIAADEGVDLLFAPDAAGMYPADYGTWIEVAGPARGLEEDFRPGQLRGVATICLKLFTIVRPNVACFGQKDAQQVAVVAQMVRDLNLELQLHVVPTVRDGAGLALSSRNARLSPEERVRALAIPRALAAGLAAHREGRDPVAAARVLLAGVAPDYVAVADLNGHPTLAIAARVGGTRLIDNVVLDDPGELLVAGMAEHGQSQKESGDEHAAGAPGPNRPSNVKVSVPELGAMKRRGERITMVTVYDAPGARLADAAGVDAALVGDSAAMTVLGHDSTLPVTVDEMLMLTRAVARGTRRPLIVADMPFGSFQPSDEVAVQNAVRFLKDGGADAVKLEGAGPMLRRAEAIVDAAIPVVGHIGLTPQSVKLLGGYKPQGRTAIKARRLVDAARALERAGCFAIVLEAMPPPVAAFITKTLTIPTIGIGAGADCDGQVLVWHDLMGLSEGHAPKFVKRYADIGTAMFAALEAYVADVRAGRFPDDRHTYAMPEHELDSFEAELMAASADDHD